MRVQIPTMLLVALCFASTVRADGNPATDNVAPLFSYGGMLERDGLAVSADVTMTFKLYDAAASNTVVWRETQVVPVSAGRFSVLLGECEGLGATARCPMGDDNSAVHISDIVRRADDIYLAIDLDTGSGPVSLQNRKRWVPVPYARLATHAANFTVSNRLSVLGPLEVQAILPKAQDWASLGTGDNGAGIYSDGRSYKKLMIVGNSSAGGNRLVGIWDDLSIARDVTIGGDLNVSGKFNIDGADVSCLNNTRNNFGQCWIYVGGYNKSYTQAASACKDIDARLCTLAEISALQAAGGEMCAYGWVADQIDYTQGYQAYPMQHSDSNCGNAIGVIRRVRNKTSLSGANCCK